MFFNKYGAIYMIVFLGPKKSRPKYFKIKTIVPRKKFLATFFSYDPLWQALSTLLLGSRRYHGDYGASYQIIALGPDRLFKTHIIWKRQPFQWRKVIALFFLKLWIVTGLR